MGAVFFIFAMWPCKQNVNVCLFKRFGASANTG